MLSHRHILTERLMVLEMATACRRASSQTTRTRWRHRSLKRTAWLCRLEGGRATPVNRLPATRRLSGNVSHEVELNTGIYRKPLTGPFPLSLQCFLLRDALPVGPRFSLRIWYMVLFPHSLSLIMKQTARRKHRDITYSWGTCRIITVRGGKKYFTF